IDDILHIKSLVAERVREGGTLVLNADDAALAKLPEHRRMKGVERDIVFVSLRDGNVTVRQHIASGGRALYLSHGRVVEAHGNRLTPVCAIDEIPMTIGGTAEFQVYNGMFAIAAVCPLGLRHEAIIAGLKDFRSAVTTPGGANLFHVGDSYVLVDYGHNP